MLGFSFTHNAKAFSGGFRYKPTMSSNLASKSGARTEGEGSDAVGLQLSGDQHRVDRARRQSEFSGEGTHPPAALRLRLLTDARLYSLPDSGIVLGRPARTWPIAPVPQCRPRQRTGATSQP